MTSTLLDLFHVTWTALTALTIVMYVVSMVINFVILIELGMLIAPQVVRPILQLLGSGR